MSLPVLIADDDNGVLSALRLLLKSEKINCDAVQNPVAAIAALKQREYGMLLMDMNYDQDTTSGEEGLELIRAAREIDSHLPIAVMTGWGSIELAVAAMRAGAADFIEKPWHNTRVLTCIKNLMELQRQQRTSARMSAENAVLKSDARSDWIAQSAAMQAMMKTIDAIAATDINILLTGENGTGKSQLAEWIHQHSSRQSASFITVNMSAIPENLFESELFGHIKGAFTDARDTRLGRFELADEGTLFFDEIAELPLSQQAKLLRVLESGHFEKVGSHKQQQANVRVVAATNANLQQRIESGSFRQDLFYRLNGIEIRVPALRERGSDVELLAQHFLNLYTKRYQRAISGFSEAARTALRQYGWPGNVRELRHCLERAVLLCPTDLIQPANLALMTSMDNGTTHSPTGSHHDWDNLTLEDAEKRLLQMALRKHVGNANAAADALGLSRSAFYRRLEKFGL